MVQRTFFSGPLGRPVIYLFTTANKSGGWFVVRSQGLFAIAGVSGEWPRVGSDWLMLFGLYRAAITVPPETNTKPEKGKMEKEKRRKPEYSFWHCILQYDKEPMVAAIGRGADWPVFTRVFRPTNVATLIRRDCHAKRCVAT